MDNFRKTTQFVMPGQRPAVGADQYDVYPAFELGVGHVELGFDALARQIMPQRVVVIDGDPAVLWDHFQTQLDRALRQHMQRPAWHPVRDALRPSAEIEALVAPFLGGDDPLFGTRFTGQLRDFFDPARLAALQPEPGAPLTILYGCGAALAGWPGMLIYVEVPKNEIQFRARAKTAFNLGSASATDPKPHYKRSYFVDWPAMRAHKAALLPRLDLIVDEQRPDEPALMSGEALRQALHALSRTHFRARPWFEPGPWGGQWMKSRIPQLPPEAPNLAWSFELISPENGLCFESDGRLLEVAFDWLMAAHAPEVLGRFAAHFGNEFPIRFDFLDTVAGGNLSVQCHPRPDYIRRHFGEAFTQDETYYILDCEEGAQVYLGFQEGVDPAAFRSALEHSQQTAQPVAVERFVQKHPAAKHDLFLIPNGTIHCSGAGNLVLEISATPYIFTFKMYDWMRLDLDGRPRPLNIARAFENLYFDRQGKAVARELIAQPQVLAHGPGWRIVHLPTHPAHFYDVHRLEFDSVIDAATGGSAQVLMVVEGQGVILETKDGRPKRYNYAETFVVPAAAESYRLTNVGPASAKVVQAFLKPDWFTRPENQWLAAPPLNR